MGAAHMYTSKGMGAFITARPPALATRGFRSRPTWRCAASPPCTQVAVREQFPILAQHVNGHPLVYLDSAATSQKPRVVLDAVDHFYSTTNAAVQPGSCGSSLATAAKDAVDAARESVARLVNAKAPDEIVFTRNATEAINLVALSWGAANLQPGDEIILSVMEHHSNLIPWQLLAKKTGAKLKFVPLSSDQDYDIMALPALLTNNTRLIACQHVSNVLGCINPVKDIVELAHGLGAKVLVDACQSVPHMPVDVQSLGCDFLVASGHKMCGPSGSGFLWAKRQLLESMSPVFEGGLNVEEFHNGRPMYGPLPERLEGGMIPTAEVVGLGAACDFLSKIGMDAVHEQELRLAAYLYRRLSSFKEVTIYGPREGPRAALCAFNVEGVHPTDLATLLDLDGIAIRSGHHCAQPLHRELGVESSARASLYIYNTEDEVDAFIAGLRSAVEMLGGTLSATTS